MNIELKQFGDLNYDQQSVVANVVATETQLLAEAEQKIVPVEAVDIFKKIGMVAFSEGEFIGYVGASAPIEHDGYEFSQIGTLLVPDSNGGKGISKGLITAVTTVIVEVEQVPFAFANQRSNGSFASAGYTEALPGELPPDAISKYDNQPLIYLSTIRPGYAPQSSELMLA